MIPTALQFSSFMDDTLRIMDFSVWIGHIGASQPARTAYTGGAHGTPLLQFIEDKISEKTQWGPKFVIGECQTHGDVGHIYGFDNTPDDPRQPTVKWEYPFWALDYQRILRTFDDYYLEGKHSLIPMPCAHMVWRACLPSTKGCGHWNERIDILRVVKYKVAQA